MGTGQTILTLSAITLYSITLNNINKAYVSSVKYAVEQQQSVEAIEIGNSITEKLYSESSSYSSLENMYGELNDVNQSTTRENYITQTGDSVAVIYDLGDEKVMIEDHKGRMVTVFVYKKSSSDEFKSVSEHKIAMLKGS